MKGKMIVVFEHKEVDREIEKIANDLGCDKSKLDNRLFNSDCALLDWLYAGHTHSEMIEIMNVKTQDLVQNKSSSVVHYLLSNNNRCTRLSSGFWLFVY